MVESLDRAVDLTGHQAPGRGRACMALIDNLRREGLEADADTSVKALATAHGKLPIEIVKLMQGPTD